jgi:hypothetical protein
MTRRGKSWFETREDALLIMRVQDSPDKTHPEETALAGVSKDEAK